MEDLIESFIEIKLKSAEDFLIICETLKRCGVASKQEKRLIQSCHILHKKQRYFILHFKELFLLDGKPSSLSQDDIARRNTIANILAEWNLLELVDAEKSKSPITPLSNIKIISAKEKKDWILESKYTIGNKNSKKH